MLEFFRNRMKDDRGFTLIELMVVVLIIAILIAIAIPTFLGLRRRAQDRAAQSDLRNGLTAAKAHFTDNETYTGFTVAVAEGIEPSLNWDTPALPNYVTMESVAAQEITLSRVTAYGQEFCIADSSTLGTVRGRGAATDFASCDALGDW